ncbi:hypothetical protein HJG60_012106 [Phyllostomus discolor]|uniref:Uncharacterized protein n=1 Tax=Phyllostomus discolor TaxID=89673 RepID=A0A833ZJT5_9CHIR|nr:hypothetical protein HJG60_012106 [Phyllostomus discolor]
MGRQLLLEGNAQEKPNIRRFSFLNKNSSFGKKRIPLVGKKTSHFPDCVKGCSFSSTSFDVQSFKCTYTALRVSRAPGLVIPKRAGAVLVNTCRALKSRLSLRPPLPWRPSSTLTRAEGRRWLWPSQLQNLSLGACLPG